MPHSGHVADGAGAGSSVPQMLNYQGRTAVGGANFTGTGQFKFALIDGGTPGSSPAHATAYATGMGQNYTIFGLFVSDPGSGYVNPPGVTLSPSASAHGSGATFTANVFNGHILSIDVNNGGSGYDDLIFTENLLIDPPPASTNFATYWSNDGSSANGGLLRFSAFAAIGS